MISEISSGHVDLADFLFLISAIAFALAAVLIIVISLEAPRVERAAVAIGLTLLAFALFVT